MGEGEGEGVVTTYYLYSDEGLIGEYDQNGNEIKTYGYKPDSTWSTDPLFMKQGTDFYFYHNDHLGTPQKMTNISGAIVWSATYDAFGKAAVDGSSSVTNNLRFPGQYFDAETELHYNGNRFYDPGTGRYVTEDPIGFGGGDYNLYAYTRNDSINLTDPEGFAAAIPVPTPVPFPPIPLRPVQLTPQQWQDMKEFFSRPGQNIKKWIETTEVPEVPPDMQCQKPPSPCLLACIRCLFTGTWYEKIWACPFCIICVPFGGFH